MWHTVAREQVVEAKECHGNSIGAITGVICIASNGALGHVAPSTSNCLILGLLVTSESHTNSESLTLTLDSMSVVGYSAYTGL